MKIANTFLSGKMNKQLDERILAPNEFRDALNIDVGSSDGTDVGAVENVRGNEIVNDMFLPSTTKALGAYTDTQNQKIYWFVSEDVIPSFDAIYEYDIDTDTTTTVLADLPNRVLNFDSSSKITGINVIQNSDRSKNLLCWTDNINPPRMINIERGKELSLGALGSIVEDDISVIKKPPRKEPTTTFTTSNDSTENNMEDKFLFFAYRYKYLDGEYSALSGFSRCMFSPSAYELDISANTNEGMRNFFNAVEIEFDSGDERVTDIQLVYKESNSFAAYIIDTFSKVDEGYADNTLYSFTFSNDKAYVQLPADEIYRTYDNVPLRARAQEVIGSRLAYGNYTEGYDMVLNNGDKVVPSFTLDYTSTTLTGTEYNIEFETDVVADDIIAWDNADVDIVTLPLDEGTRLIFGVSLNQADTTGTFSYEFQFILPADYPDMNALAADPDFIDWIASWSGFFEDNYINIDPEFGTLASITPFEIVSSSITTIRLRPPVMTYDISDPVSTLDAVWVWDTLFTKFILSATDVATTLKSNRNLEVGIVYYDEWGRMSTPQVCKTNTIYIRPEDADKQNRLQITITSPPPVWADRYKFVIKQDKKRWHNFFSNFFYQDTGYRWLKVEGANINKVKEGDTLVVKVDNSGFVDELVEVTVIEISQKAQDFLGENVNDIDEEAGKYLKIRPNGFDMSNLKEDIVKVSQTIRVRNGRPTCRFFNIGVERDPLNLDVFIPRVIPQGTKIKVFFRNYESDGYDKQYEKEFFAADTYNNGFNEFWEQEVPSLGVADAWFTVDYLFLEDGGQTFTVTGAQPGTRTERSKLYVSIAIFFGSGSVVLETIPEDDESDLFFETSETFDLTGTGWHSGNIQNQTAVQEAIVELNFFNAYAMGNGVESIAYRDDFNSNWLNIDTKPTIASIEPYKEVSREYDITYSAPYNENNNLNGLNEFNLARANFKEDIEKSFGSIQKLVSRETDLVVFQEHKVSRVLFGKNLLSNADGAEGNVTFVKDVLNQQIPYKGEWGIGTYPESYAFNGFYMYWADPKRGAVLRLAGDGINDIASMGMEDFFIDKFLNSYSEFQLGAYDPYTNKYVLTANADETLTFSDQIKGWTSRHSFIPEFMIGINNEFYSFYQGQLWRHHSDNVPRNNFYGVQYDSTLSFVINQEPQTIKELQALSLQGNVAWDVDLEAFVDMSDNTINSSISSSEFNKKEGYWYAYTRRNESPSQLDSKAVYGLGEVTATDIISLPAIITITGYNQSLTEGDVIVNATDGTIAGTVVSSVTTGNTTVISVSGIGTTVIGDFVYGRKNGRIEGSKLRGYGIRANMTNSNTDKTELFAVVSDISKSYT